MDLLEDYFSKKNLPIQLLINNNAFYFRKMYYNNYIELDTILVNDVIGYGYKKFY
jgi:hypothetical protein